jgi:hypothetical protein
MRNHDISWLKGLYQILNCPLMFLTPPLPKIANPREVSETKRQRFRNDCLGKPESCSHKTLPPNGHSGILKPVKIGQLLCKFLNGPLSTGESVLIVLMVSHYVNDMGVLATKVG